MFTNSSRPSFCEKPLGFCYDFNTTIVLVMCKKRSSNSVKSEVTKIGHQYLERKKKVFTDGNRPNRRKRINQSPGSGGHVQAAAAEEETHCSRKTGEPILFLGSCHEAF